MIISSGNGVQKRPMVTLGSGLEIFQLGQISAVASRNFTAIWFSTWPLYGIPFGRTTSNAEIRSVVTITRYLSSILYTSRTFPVYRLFWPGKRKLVFSITLLIGLHFLTKLNFSLLNTDGTDDN